MNEGINYISCLTSSAHTYGNITAIIQKKILDMFPQGLFKTIHVNSKIAHKQLRSTTNEVFKKEKPMMILRPRIDWDSSNMFMGETLVNERMTDIYSKYGGTNLEDFILDRKHNICMKFKLDRCVLNFDVVLIFSTLMEQINYATFIRNNIGNTRSITINTAAESYLSPDLMKIISDISGVPMLDASGSVEPFVKYLNGISRYPITYRLQGSTNSTEFYRYYPLNIDTIINGLSTDEGEKVGQVMSQYQLSFNIRAEFWGTGFYYLFSNKLNKTMTLPVPDNATIIPVYTDVICAEDYDLKDGWQLYTQPSCKLDNPNDEIDISSLFNASLKHVIRRHIATGVPWTNFIDIRIRQQGKPMTSGVNYIVDMENMKIKFIRCGVYYTYKILIYVNVEYVNSMVEDILDDSRPRSM
jgi:hypothetical protein